MFVNSKFSVFPFLVFVGVAQEQYLYVKYAFLLKLWGVLYSYPILNGLTGVQRKLDMVNQVRC